MNVVCVCVGDRYSSEYVYRLQRAVSRHLPYPHLFTCMSDRQLDCRCARSPAPHLRGWWQKMALFHPEMEYPSPGRALYLDLDVVVVGSLMDFMDYDCDAGDLHVLEEFRRGGSDQINSSVMAFWPQKTHWIWREWQRSGFPMPDQGDQEVLREITRGRCHTFKRDLAWSHKFDERPANGRVCVFHGTPKPHQVPQEPIVKEGWR